MRYYLMGETDSGKLAEHTSYAEDKLEDAKREALHRAGQNNERYYIMTIFDTAIPTGKAEWESDAKHNIERADKAAESAKVKE